MPVEALFHGPEGWPDEHGYLTLFDGDDGVAAWCHEWLQVPDGVRAGEPWVFTPSQARFLAWWYAYEKKTSGLYGWVFRRGVLRLSKGRGKDPLGAVMALVDAFGPGAFDPVSGSIMERPGWVQIAAVSYPQTRTMTRLFPGLLPKRTRDEFEIEVNKSLITGLGGRSQIEAIATNPSSQEGPRPTLAIKNEVQNWKANNEGHELSSVIDGNLAKSQGGLSRSLALCNAHREGDDSLGEREWLAFKARQEGRTRTTDVLYWSEEAPGFVDLADEDALREALEAVRGDSVWLDIDRLMGEVYDLATEPGESRRKYLNQISAQESDGWIQVQWWDDMSDPSLRLEPGDAITLGFDGSIVDDHSALIATRLSDGAWFTLGVWEPMGDGRIPRDKIRNEVALTFEKFKVVAFFSDVHPWEDDIASWEQRWGRDMVVKASTHHAIGWDMRGARGKLFATEAAMPLRAEIVEGTFKHDGHPKVRIHLANAVTYGHHNQLSFRKVSPDSSRKIDSAAAGALSRLAYRKVMLLPEHKRGLRTRSGRVMA